MTDDSLLKQIGELIETKLKPIKKQLGALDAKVGSHDAKFESLEKKITSVDTKVKSHDAKFDSLNTKLKSHDAKFDSLDAKLNLLDTKIELVNKRIEESQEETIEALSELIQTGHTMHEKRIRNIENHLHLAQPHE